VHVTLIILAAAVVTLTVVAAVRGGPALTLAGYREALQLLGNVGPQLLLGFALGGLVTVLVPVEFIASVLGEESGLRGVLIGTVAGIITPGGPYLHFPLVAALVSGGAGIGPVTAYLSAWSLVGAQRALIWEIPVLGTEFALARWAASLLVPVALGMVVPAVFRLLTRSP
jgi:uncharacterized membrane protein YraQ (UPF0718 family)